MIKKIVKNSLFLVLIAGTLNVASAQETKIAEGKPSNTNHGVKPVKSNNGQLFDKLDLDKNGRISKDEAMKSNNERFTGNFDRIDTNKDGNVSREELKSSKNYVNTTPQPQKNKDSNPKLDANNDGKISHDEAYKSGNQYYINNFEKLDTNKDGFISKEEKQSGKASKKATKTTVKKTQK